jgi:5-methyltetrahydrofolate--homocysteine methyltransferase
MEDALFTAMADLKEDEAMKILDEKLAAGEDPYKILDIARGAMGLVGSRFASGEYFIPDLVYSGEILKEVSNKVKPLLTGEDSGSKETVGKFLLATVAGDIHDIGKDIVAFMFDVNGFEVIDMGIDVPVQKIVDAVKENKPDVVGLSGFLTLAFDAMKETIEAIKAAGLRDDVKIMIGGGQIDEEIRKYTGADAYRPDAVSGVLLAKEWMGVN